MRSLIKCFFMAAWSLLPLSLVAQTFNPDSLKLVKKASVHEGRLRITFIENRCDTTIQVELINEYDVGDKKRTRILKKGEFFDGDVTLNVIRAKAINDSTWIEILRESTPQAVKNHTECMGSHPNDSTVRILDNFINGSIPFLSTSARTKDSITISKHLECLNMSSTIKNVFYIKDEKLKDYVRDYCDSIRSLREKTDAFIDTISGHCYFNDDDFRESYMIELKSTLKERINDRESLIEPLRVLIENNSIEAFRLDRKTAIVGIGAIVLLVILILWYKKANKAQRLSSKIKTIRGNERNEEDVPSLIVLGDAKTHSLKKQNIDDVYENAAYLRIDSHDFCAESSVRTLYVKNSCIKDIYNMYADDLRNPKNPKEDGCMVLGRWILDETTHLYDVTLEYIIKPGDDAVLSEYELNFGGKIKLKVSDKLRKLRRETDLQYDLTCWVHSHPGLGVFFSNSDNNVHMQLKHPDHPKFLTAFVIDILTPRLDTGIFTFKRDEEVNSKNELTQMYSLEEMYKWALESERNSFDANDYYDVLGQAKSHLDYCSSIQLSNSAIIDMTFFTSNPNGFIGFVQGYTIERGSKTHCIITAVSRNQTVANNERLGCFVVASHCSIPSVRKTVANYLNSIRFVLVYTAADGLLTSIPVVNQDLCTIDEFYGDQQLEDLKIWTRRRR